MDTLTENEQWEYDMWIDSLKREHAVSLPHYTELQWLEIFPEARPALKRTLRESLNKLKAIANDYMLAKQVSKNTAATLPPTQQHTYLADMEAYTQLEDQARKEIKHIAWTLRVVEGKAKNVDMQQAIESAKRVPLTEFFAGKLKAVGSGRFQVSCPLHNEKTASFTIYPNNTYYCYGCHAGGDVINFITQRDKVTPMQAIKFLSHGP